MEQPTSPDVPQLLRDVQQLIEKDDLAGAFSTLRTVLEYDAGQRSAWFYTGQLCYLAQDYFAAERAFSFAICLYPRDIGGRIARARARFALGEHDAALDDIEFLTRERRVSPIDEVLLELRSDILYGQARYQWALDDINEVVRLNPHREDARRWRDEMMRRLLRCSGEAEELAAQIDALQAHQEAASEETSTDDLPPLNPAFEGRERPNLLVSLALAYENAGRENDADEVVQSLSEEFDSDAYVCVNIGDIEFRRRNLVGARYWAQRSLALAPNYGGSSFLLGQIEAEITRREHGTWLEERAWQHKLIAARNEYEPALTWANAQWKTHFSVLGEVDFSKVLRKDDDPQAAEYDAPPTATNWDEVVEEFKAQDEDE